MAKTNTFECIVITPDRKVLECDARFVAFPAHDGEMGILHDRAPLLAKLGIGWLRVETETGEQVLYVDRGFIEVVDNQVTILTEQAGPPESLHLADAQRLLEAAHALEVTNDVSYYARLKAIEEAQTRVALAQQGR